MGGGGRGNESNADEKIEVDTDNPFLISSTLPLPVHSQHVTLRHQTNPHFTSRLDTKSLTLTVAVAMKAQASSPCVIG